MNTDLCLSVPTNPKILCWQERIFLREIRALRGFAVNPGLDFHREGAKHAKKTRRTLVWLRLGCSLFICGFILFRRKFWLPGRSEVPGSAQIIWKRKRGGLCLDAQSAAPGSGRAATRRAPPPPRAGGALRSLASHRP